MSARTSFRGRRAAILEYFVHRDRSERPKKRSRGLRSIHLLVDATCRAVFNRVRIVLDDATFRSYSARVAKTRVNSRLEMCRFQRNGIYASSQSAQESCRAWLSSRCPCSSRRFAVSGIFVCKTWHVNIPLLANTGKRGIENKLSVISTQRSRQRRSRIVQSSISRSSRPIYPS